jgi:FMN phosphatase YigB (HAD superfamily)
LIDWERGILAELRPWADRAGRKDLGDNVLLETFGTVEAACEAEFPGKLYPQILEEVLRRLAAQWDIKTSADDAAAFGQSVGRWPAFADSATSLQYLKRYYKLVILSNVDRASFAKSNERLQVEFDRILRDSIRIFRLRHLFLFHRKLTCSVHRNRRSKNKTLYLLLDRLVYEIDAAN